MAGRDGGRMAIAQKAVERVIGLSGCPVQDMGRERHRGGGAVIIARRLQPLPRCRYATTPAQPFFLTLNGRRPILAI